MKIDKEKWGTIAAAVVAVILFLFLVWGVLTNFAALQSASGLG